MIVIRDAKVSGAEVASVDASTESCVLSVFVVDTVTNNVHVLPLTMDLDDVKFMSCEMQGAFQVLTGDYVSNDDIQASLDRLLEQIDG